MATVPHVRNGSANCTLMVGYNNPNLLCGTHVKLDGDVIAFTYNLTTGEIRSILLSTVVSNRLELPLFDANDNHYYVPMGVGAHGSLDRLYVFGNHHDNLSTPSANMHAVYCADITDITNTAQWNAGSEPGAALDDSTDGGTYTYHFTDRDSDGTLYWFHSQSPDRGLGEGRDYLGFKKTSAASDFAVMFGNGRVVETFDGPADEADRAYLFGIYIEGPDENNPDRLHIAGNFRTNDFDADSSTCPFYAYSDTAGATWRNISGTLLTMPITWANRANVEIDSAPDNFNITRNGIIVNPTDSRPSVHVRNLSGTFFRLFWTGSAWASEESTPQVGGFWPRDFYFGSGGTRWWATGTARRFRITDGTTTVMMGGHVSTSEGNYVPDHDRVLLREQGIYAVNVGDGDLPAIRTWGDNVRFN